MLVVLCKGLQALSKGVSDIVLRIFGLDVISNAKPVSLLALSFFGKLVYFTAVVTIAAARAQYVLSFVIERGTCLKYKD